MNQTLKKIPAILLALLTPAAMILFLAFPARYTSCVRDGVTLWAVCVLPATFPFLFLTALFRRQSLYPRLLKVSSPVAGKLFRVSGAGGCAAVLSALSGYPVGAREVFDLYRSGQIQREESFRLACLCSTSGPMFLVGGVGSGILHSPTLGWIMLFSHLFSVWTVCFFLRFTGKRPSTKPALVPPRGGDLYEHIYSSVISILCVGGSIALFYTFAQMASDALALVGVSGQAAAFLAGLFEMTTGCKLFSSGANALSAGACAFFVTFGGLCVLVQQIAYLNRAGVKTLPFVGVKLLQGVLSFALCFGLCLLLGY